MINRNQIKKFSIFLLTTIFSVVNKGYVFAQPDSEVETVEPDIFGNGVNTDLGGRGVLETFFFIGGFVILIFFFLVLIYIIITAVKMIGARDDSAKLSEGSKSMTNFSIGIVVAIFFLMLYALISIMLGGSNIFSWTSKLAQCHDGEFLFKAEYSAAAVNPDIFNEEALIYCCENLTVTSPTAKENIKKSWDISDHLEIPSAAVGTKEDGGWLFISDPKGGKRYVIPEDIQDAQGCEPFTI